MCRSGGHCLGTHSHAVVVAECQLWSVLGPVALMGCVQQCTWQLERASVPELAAWRQMVEFVFGSRFYSHRRQYSRRLFDNGPPPYRPSVDKIYEVNKLARKATV